jgi:hypothetical protein
MYFLIQNMFYAFKLSLAAFFNSIYIYLFALKSRDFLNLKKMLFQILNNTSHAVLLDILSQY